MREMPVVTTALAFCVAIVPRPVWAYVLSTEAVVRLAGPGER